MNIEKFVLTLLLLGTGCTVAFSYLFFREIQTQAAQAYANEDECVPYNLDVTNVTKTKVQINWSTSGSCSGYVLWGDSIEDLTKMAVGKNSLTKVDSQTVEIAGLGMDSTYYYYIVSAKGIYGDTSGRPLVVKTEGY